jgi:hypothetical protein
MSITVGTINYSNVNSSTISLKSPLNILYTDLALNYNSSTKKFDFSFAPNVVGTWLVDNIKISSNDGQSYLFKGTTDTFVVASNIRQEAPGGGGGTVKVIELAKSSNITGYCGDNICQSGEDPTNCWQDCKINYDTLISCIW